MGEKKLSSREKIVISAVELFLAKGVTGTTTKEIAEQAGVNEVTLFRQFGSKHGLLLAVLQEVSVREHMQAALSEVTDSDRAVRAYGSVSLKLLSRLPEMVRSLIGESSQFPPENREALSQVLRQTNLQTVDYLRMARVQVPGLSVDAIASLLNTLLFGQFVLDASADGSGLWQNSADFLAALEQLFSVAGQAEAAAAGPVVQGENAEENAAEVVADLPSEVVRSLFQKAKKQGGQEHALVHVLFGAGLRIEECAGLMRSHVFTSKNQHLLTVAGRQVPVNRWIMGDRYGTYQKNPLTQWIKSRQDDRPEVFVSESGVPFDTEALTALWHSVAEGVVTTTSSNATPFQARQTWCIELLMKGMSLENLSILSGLSLEELAPYAQRAKEKAALEQALAIDTK